MSWGGEMKKKILMLLILLSGVSLAQNFNQNDVLSKVNSTTTALNSAGVFTGKAENILYQSSITVLIKSNVAGTWSAQFSSDGTNWDLKYPYTYVAGDSSTEYILPVVGNFFRIIYTNGGTIQTFFRLQTIYHKPMIIPINDNKVDVNVGSSALPSGAATSANQTTQIAKEDSLVDVGTATANSLNQIDNSVDGNYLNVNVNLAGVDASVNTGNANATTQRVVLASDQPTVAVTLSPTDTVTVKSIVNALPAGTNNIGDVDVLSIATGDNNIGNMDIVSLPSGNLGQQLSAASLSVTPATNITDATYIGDIKFGEALPAGSAIVGQVGINQTTDGTTNKVQARNATHDNFQTNATLQVGDVDVANGNPVPVSDAGGSLTVDGTVTANAGTNLNTSALSLEATQIDVKANQTNGTQTTRSVSYSLPSYTTFTAGVAADTLSGVSVACVKVTIMNASAGKVLYYGFNGSVTTANGQGALGYLDTATLYVTNLNKIYLISDSASTDVRVTYFNY